MTKNRTTPLKICDAGHDFIFEEIKFNAITSSQSYLSRPVAQNNINMGSLFESGITTDSAQSYIFHVAESKCNKNMWADSGCKHIINDHSNSGFLIPPISLL